MKEKCILWFRKDLRLHDNPSLIKALEYNKILPIFIFDKTLYEYKKIGSASLWWLEKSLIELDKRLNGKLLVVEGDSYDLVPKICNKFSANAIFWNRCYEPDRIVKDSKIKKNLLENNINAVSSNSSLLWEPWTIKNKSGNFYKVFTPFYKRGCLESTSPKRPIKISKRGNFISIKQEFSNYKFRFLNKKHHWSSKFEKYWTPGEDGARKKCNSFFSLGASLYSDGRNFPNLKAVSRLSPHIHWGEISIFQLWHLGKDKMKGLNKDTFLSELAWREFSYYLLYHFPNIYKENLKSNFNAFNWGNNDKHIDLWKNGLTGYPIVDAGMRELWETGYMHNRARMITSSFLVKNLLSHWKYGEQWFWDCLVDADLASNSASWQWVAGTGTDAAPFFRIFNPITQAIKFDQDCQYIKRFIPELSKLPNKFVFSPWTADESVLSSAGVKLGRNYPKPIIDYQFSRSRALKEFKELKNKNL